MTKFNFVLFYPQTFDKTGAFWQGLPRMATSTPFPSRPTSAENTEDSVSDPYGATTLQPTHHTLSSGIGKYIELLTILGCFGRG